MLKAQSYLVLGIDTDIGKTFLVENLCKNLRKKKIAVSAIKPIVSGFDANDKNSDSAKILTALGREISKKTLDEISPWRFKDAVSPHLAGKINFPEVVKFCRKKIAEAKKNNEVLFIEAAGGVMTPITDTKTFLDLACALDLPILLVSANYLGSISHTLCAVSALKNKKLRVKKIILNEDLPVNKKSGINNRRMIETLEKLSKARVQTCFDRLSNRMN
jgi:dethiobiotin synthetase